MNNLVPSFILFSCILFSCIQNKNEETVKVVLPSTPIKIKPIKINHTSTKYKANDSEIRVIKPKVYLQNNSNQYSAQLTKTKIDSNTLLKFAYNVIKTGTHINSIGDTIITNSKNRLIGESIKITNDDLTAISTPTSLEEAEYQFKIYSEKQGLASSYLMSLIQDSIGNFWIGTNSSGLIQFDGTYANTFRTENGLADNNIYDLIEDKFHRIWIATNNGLSVYDGNSFLNYTEKNGLISNEIRTLFEDSQGNIWIGFARGGVGVFAKDSIKFLTSEEGLPKSTIKSIIEDKSGNIWLASSGNGIFKFNGIEFINFTIKSGLKSDFVSVISAKEDQIWIGGEKGSLSVICKDSIVQYNNNLLLIKNNIRYIEFGTNNSIWIGTDGNGLIKLDSLGIQLFDNSSGLSNNHIWSLLTDENDNLWIATFGGGLNMLQTNSFKYFLPHKLFHDLSCWSILRTKQNSFWFGSYGKGLFKYEKNKIFQYSTKEGLENDIIISMVEDDEGSIWCGTSSKGILKFDGKFFYSFSNIEPFQNSGVWSATKDKQGNLWFSISKGGIVKYDGTNFEYFQGKDYLSKYEIWHLLVDSTNNLWLGTYDGGLIKYERNNFYRITGSDKIENAKVNSLALDYDQKLWIGTESEGVYIQTENQWENIKKSNGLSNNNIFSIIMMDSLAWVGTGKGLNLIEQQNKEFNIYNWTQDLKGEEFIQNSVHLSKYNLLWGTNKGILQLDHNLFNLPKRNPRLFIKKTLVNEELICNDFLSSDFRKLDLQLPHSKNHLTFVFSAIDWINPQRLQYSFKLEGFDKEWSNLSEENKSDYRNLPPGKYEFKVKALSFSKKWSDVNLTKFVINPPWWQTRLSLIIYFFLFLFGIRTIVYLRSKSLINERNNLELIVKDRTNQLQKSLIELKSTQSQLIQKEKLASLGELTAGIAHEIQNPLNFVNNFSELNKDLIKELKQETINGNIEEINILANDIENNSDKINFHGQRVSNIIKNMLEHSTISKNSKIEGDINSLCEEYTKIAYQSFKNKYKDFKCDYKYDFDLSIPKIKIVNQDIARVILNLLNNAFYALRPIKGLSIDYSSSFSPIVVVSTKNKESLVEIRIIDNGIGIPDNFKDKIFNPFFTTKPTGEGTGLGLSLSHDIVKAHGGDLILDSSDHTGTTFVISLPIS